MKKIKKIAVAVIGIIAVLIIGYFIHTGCRV